MVLIRSSFLSASPRFKLKVQFDEIEFLNKTQIHGHWARTIQEIEESVNTQINKFSIDSSCYLDRKEYGYLTALELDTMKLWLSKRKLVSLKIAN